MKTLASTKLLLALIFCVSPFCMAQDPANCEQLRDKLSKLESLNISGMSSSVRQLYLESSRTLNTQFRQCLEQDISSTSEMQNAVAGTSVAPAVEEKLRSLRNEKAGIDAKLIALTTLLNPGTTQERHSSGFGASSSGSRENSSTELVPNSSPPAAIAPVASALPPSPQAAVTCIPGADYGDAPLALSDVANKAAADVVRRNDPNRAIFPISEMILYTVFDAASPTSSKLVRELGAYEYLSETARTDKQLGGSSNSNAAVGAIEKPGFASLLGFAIENGAINKKNDGTNLTLSTSLYSLYAFNKPKTAESYASAGLLNRVGLSASFAVENKDNDLLNARRNNLNEWSVKTRLFGDRSTRSPGFRKFWNEKVRPLIGERLLSLGSAVESLSSRLDSYDSIERATRRCLPNLVKQRMADADYAAATDEGKKKIISDLILNHLKSNVFNQVASGPLKPSNKEIADIEQEFIPRLKRALDNLVLADKQIKEEMAALNKSPLGTFAYTNHRIPTGSDYSETKFLFEQDKGPLGPLKLTGNFGLSFYNKPDPTLNQQKLRDVTAALSFEGATDSPFSEAGNQSKITYSFVGRYERFYENRNRLGRTPDVRVLQFLTEIPFLKGLSLPLSLSYANATEEEKKQHWRFNFGMHLDTDKLFELLGKSRP
jgi:hypothetical protein